MKREGGERKSGKRCEADVKGSRERESSTLVVLAEVEEAAAALEAIWRHLTVPHALRARQRVVDHRPRQYLKTPTQRLSLQLSLQSSGCSISSACQRGPIPNGNRSEQESQ
eukprot:2699354-Rhodomonas_salina.3